MAMVECSAYNYLCIYFTVTFSTIRLYRVPSCS